MRGEKNLKYLSYIVFTTLFVAILDITPTTICKDTGLNTDKTKLFTFSSESYLDRKIWYS